MWRIERWVLVDNMLVLEDASVETFREMRERMAVWMEDPATVEVQFFAP